jgi:peptidyl-prolyl cis-trans isomerase D
MAKPAETEEKKPRKRGTTVMGWLLLAMIAGGLGGFGVTNFGGGVTSVGSVGGTDISVNDYARAVRQEAAAFSAQLGTQIGVSEALAFGLDKQALAGLVSRAALDNEAQRIGVSIGDESVAAEVMKQQSFQGLSGKFDRETYRMTLQQNGWTEREYETAVRGDVARSLLQGAVTGGFAAPQPMVDAMYRYIAERRGFSMIRLSEADLATPLPEPTDAALKAHYDAHLDRFTKPESKRIAYALLLPDMIAADQPVDDAVLKKMYDDRIADFVQPERRLVERLVYPDAAARDTAEARLKDGSATFEQLVEERGLTLDAIDLGDVSEADLGAAGATVFAAGEGAVVAGDSALGPALFRMNGVLEGQNTSFEDAREDLAGELQMDAARRAIADMVEQIDDLLAGGATLEDLAKEMGMEFATLDHVPGQQGTEPVEGYQAFRNAAEAVQEGDFPEAIVLEDGGVVALEFKQTVPAAPIPFDEARDKVAEDWQKETLAKALSDQAVAFKAAAEAGTALGALGIVDVTPEIARDGFVEGAPKSLLPDVFLMQPGDLKVIEDGDFVALVRLDAITPAEETGDAAAALKSALASQIEQAFAADAMQGYTGALQDAAGIQLDQAAITAVNTSLQ